MSKILLPIDYRPELNMKQTEQGIKLIKEFFQQNLSTELRLSRVTAPLFVLKGLGINGRGGSFTGQMEKADTG